jgi:hypothetical protein
MCAAVPALGAGGSCVRQCSPSTNGSECPADQACVAQARFGSTTSKYICMPGQPKISH